MSIAAVELLQPIERFDLPQLENHWSQKRAWGAPAWGNVTAPSHAQILGGETEVLNILVVEDDPQLALTIKQLIECNPRFRVTSIAGDLPSALEAAREKHADLALVDLQLANATSGFSVAAKLQDMNVLCLFMTGSVPSFPLPDLAIGCLAKPFREDDLVRALTEAEDILRGRPKIVRRAKLPDQLQIYSAPEPSETADTSWMPPVRGRTSLGARLLKLIRRPSHFRSAIPLG